MTEGDRLLARLAAWRFMISLRDLKISLDEPTYGKLVKRGDR